MVHILEQRGDALSSPVFTRAVASKGDLVANQSDDQRAQSPPTDATQESRAHAAAVETVDFDSFRECVMQKVRVLCVVCGRIESFADQAREIDASDHRAPHACT